MYRYPGPSPPPHMSGAECPEWGHSAAVLKPACWQHLGTSPGRLHTALQLLAFPGVSKCSHKMQYRDEPAYVHMMSCISTARSSINFITGTLDRSASQRGNVVQEMQFSLTSDGRYGALHKNTCFFSLLLLILHWYLMLFDTYPPEFAGHVYCADIYNSLCIHHVADVLLLWCDMLYPPATSCPVSCIGRAAPHMDI